MRGPRNLLGRLLARSPEALRDIATCWETPLGARDHAANAGRLYGAMRDIWAIRDRAEQLPPDANAIVDTLLMAGDAALTLEELAGETKFDLRSTVETLEHCGMLHRERPSDGEDESVDGAFFLPRELVIGFGRVREEQLLGDALGPRIPLRALLSTLEMSELETAAPIWGLRITPGLIERDTLTDELLAQVRLPEQRRQVIQGLSGPAAWLFRELRSADRPLPVNRLRDRLKLDAHTFRDIARALADRLLIWHAYAGDERLLFIPRDIVAPRVAPHDRPPALVATRATPLVEYRHPFGTAWDLLSLLRGLTLGTFEWHEGDEDRNATHVRRIAPALWPTASGRPQRGYLPLLLGLGEREGLLRVVDGLVTPTDLVEDWRAKSFPEQLVRLLEAWRASAEWLEGVSQDDLQLLHVDWPAMRAPLLDELRSLHVGAWYDADTLAVRIGRLHPGLLGGKFSAAFASDIEPTRDEVTSLAVNVALRGGLARLGLLDEGAQPDNRLALALNPVGAWLLGRRPDPPRLAAGGPPLTIDDDLSLQLHRPTPRRVWALGAIADVVALGAVSRYRLTRATVRRAIATGVTPDNIVTFLERGTAAPLPPGVREVLAGWSAGHRGIRLARALILRLDDPAQQAQLTDALAGAALPEPIALPGGSYLVRLPDDNRQARLLDTLRAAGFAIYWEP